jgi:hypothetical protein
MLPEIFKRATVLMPDVHLNDLLHRFDICQFRPEIAAMHRDWMRLRAYPATALFFPRDTHRFADSVAHAP